MRKRDEKCPEIMSAALNQPQTNGKSRCVGFEKLQRTSRRYINSDCEIKSIMHMVETLQSFKIIRTQQIITEQIHGSEIEIASSIRVFRKFIILCLIQGSLEINRSTVRRTKANLFVYVTLYRLHS